MIPLAERGADITPFPRLLVIDSTRVGALSATGQIKKNLLTRWPGQQILQLWAPRPDQLALAPRIGDQAEDVRDVADNDVLQAVSAFRPEVIYYRPTIDQQPKLHRLASMVMRAERAPLVTHIMDDWPSRLAAGGDGRRASEADRAFREVLARSHSALSISKKMSAVFGERYGVEFEPIANGVDPDLYRAAGIAAKPVKEARDEVVLRYCGALAKDMTFDTILDVARAVDALSGELAVRFEIYTMPTWKQPFETAVSGLRGVEVFDAAPDGEYPALLAEADVLVLGYNFDAEAVRYIGLSMPNKLPEYLASGAAVLGVGPLDANGIEYLASAELGYCVTERDDEVMAGTLRRLVTDASLRNELGERGQRWAFEHLDVQRISERFEALLVAASGSLDGMPLVGPVARDRRAWIDETHAIAGLLAAAREGVMLDIGAHHGSSLQPFADAGWSVVACEPDPANREPLLRRFGARGNITIDSRAVSDQAAEGVAFFTSEESSGISALRAFRETHKESARVDVTTVADLVAAHAIPRIDFLKIDVEGHDWNVIKGVPWDRMQPDVIECEFEDAKTAQLGHTYSDIADYLVQRGYVVYLSEWHPIVRYGVPHEWNQLLRYPAPLGSSDAWGNILAFQDDPGPDAIKTTFLAQLHEENPSGNGAEGSRHGSDSVAAPSPTGGNRLRRHAPTRHSRDRQAEDHVSPRGPRYERFYQRASRNPLVFVLGRVAMWSARKAKRHPFLAAAYVCLLAALVAGGFLATDHWYGPILLVAAGLAGIGGLLVAAMGFMRFLIKEARHDLLLRQDNLRHRVEGTERQLRAAPEATAKLDAKLDELLSLQTSTHEALAADIGTLKLDWDSGAALEAKISEVESAQATSRENMKALELEIEALEVKLKDAPASELSVDIVSALRQVHPLWMGQNGARGIDPEVEREHGHAALMALLVDEERRRPGSLKGKTLVEVGSTRERDPDQGSTEKLAIFTGLIEMRFVSVDMDPMNTQRANKVIRHLNPAAEAITERGETYLAVTPEPFDYVYLDAFDFDHGQHSQERQDRYREVLKTEISDQACWQMHQLCAAALITKMPDEGVVVIDDTWRDEDGEYDGKGKFAVPLLLASGFKILSQVPRAIALKRSAG